MKKRAGVKRSSQHPNTLIPSVLSTQSMYDKYNPGICPYKKCPFFLFTPPIFDFKNLRVDKKGHIQKIKIMQKNIKEKL